MQTPLGSPASGVVILDEPNPNGRTRALLSRDQNHLGRGTLAMRGGQMKVAPEGDGPAKADKAQMINPAEIGLRMAPIMVQRGEDAPLVANPVDGTSASLERLTVAARSGAVSGVIGADTPVVDAQPVAEAASADTTPLSTVNPQVTDAVTSRRKTKAPKQAAVEETPVLQRATKPRRVRLQGPKIGRLTVFCRDVIVSPTLVILVFPTDGTSAIVEPPQGETVDVETGDQAPVACVSNDYAFERGDEMFVVLLRLPA